MKQDRRGGSNRHKRTARVPLLSSRFRYARHPLRCGVARFYADRLELQSLHFNGFRRRTVLLISILDMDYHPLAEGANLTLHLDSDETISLHIKEAHLWREAFENWLNYQVLASAKLLGGPEKASSMSG